MLRSSNFIRVTPQNACHIGIKAQRHLLVLPPPFPYHVESLSRYLPLSEECRRLVTVVGFRYCIMALHTHSSCCQAKRSCLMQHLVRVPLILIFGIVMSALPTYY